MTDYKNMTPEEEAGGGGRLMGKSTNCVLGWNPWPYAGRNPRWERRYGRITVQIRRSTFKPKAWEYNIDDATYWMTFSASATSVTLAQTEAHSLMRQWLTEALDSLEANPQTKETK